MPLTPGSRVGPYEIVGPLGSGGMGEVYRARDRRLERDVAIKVLPDAVAHDPERLARFEREARLLAASNHAGIASVFGVEDADGTRALIMELVEGPTLDDRIASGRLPADEVLGVARQLAEALEYAHERGIVHRDLKPANVKLRPDGTVKVLDFGLARALDTQASAPVGDLSQSPTITQRMTQAGMILGTAAYMSPEQARGREADRRADIWAFGVVIYEMLTGRSAFAGETISDTLASVMRDDPDWSALPPRLSQRWRVLLQRCLAKEPRQRLQAIGEARIALEDLAAHPEDPALSRTYVPPRRRLLRVLSWLIGAAALGLLAVVIWRRPPSVPTAIELSIVPSGGRKISGEVTYQPMAIAPDGKAVAYTVRDGGLLKLRVRRLDTREDREIPGADGAHNQFFSRDGQWIAFFDGRKLSKVSVRGGTPVELTNCFRDRLGTWLDDGTIVYSGDVTGPLQRVSEAGGVPTAITRLDSTKGERTHRNPCALDGGPWVVFTAQTVDSPGDYDDATIDAVSVKTGERRHLFKGARRAVWAHGGFLVLARGGDLYAVPIDPRNPRITHDPVPVLGGVSGDAASGASFFSIADDGTLAWIPEDEPERIRDVGWFDRSGNWTPTAIAAGPYVRLALSPDNTRAIILAGPGGAVSDLWLGDLRTGGMNRLTYGGRSGYGAWIPDGIHIAHAQSDTTGGQYVVVRRLDGVGGGRVIFHTDHPVNVTDVTPDGRQVVFSDYGMPAGRIHLAAVDGGSPSRELSAEGEGSELSGVVSPDGRWLAYLSNKTRWLEVCVRRLGGGGGSWQVSTNGGGGVRWGREGRELFFVSDETLMRAPVQVRGEDLTIGPPERMFEVPPSPTETYFREYDYDPIGDRFLFTRPPRGVAERREIALSLGWTRRLRDELRASRRNER